jgi:hypothetical protein
MNKVLLQKTFQSSNSLLIKINCIFWIKCKKAKKKPLQDAGARGDNL